MRKLIQEQPYMQEKWFLLLKEQVALKNLRTIAQELNYSITTLSLIINGKYVGKTDRFRDAILKHNNTVDCPYQNKLLKMSECCALSSAPAPTHNPMKMQQWRACQSCPNNPKCGEKS